MMNGGGKVLIFDIETTPHLIWAWNTYQTDALKVEQESYLLCYAYKWLGQKTIHFESVEGDEDDERITQKMWELFDEADVLVAYNGDKFDIRKMNGRFLRHKLGRPSPFLTVDPLKTARKHFANYSNKLDALGEIMGNGRKVTHQGMALWFGCMEGDPKAWATMRKYNKQDVQLLEDTYVDLLEWTDNHPPMNMLTGRMQACPKCGMVGDMQSRGVKYSKQGSRRQFQCMTCRGWSSARLMDKRTNDQRPDYI